MKIILRGTIAHILMEEKVDVSEIIQDIMLDLPKKYNLEIHLNRNHNVISLIILNIRKSHEELIKILKYFAKKYSKLSEPKYNSITHTFLQIIKEIRKIKPLYPRNMFRLDLE